MKNFNISTRLAAAFGVVTLLLTLVAGVAWQQLRHMEAAMTEVSVNWLPSVEAIKDLSHRALQLRLAESRALLTSDAERLANELTRIANEASAFEHERGIYVERISSAEERQLADEMASIWKRYQQQDLHMVAQMRTRSVDQARTALNGESHTDFDALEAKLGQLAKLNHDGAMAASRDADGAYHSALIWLLLISAAAIVAAIASGFLLSRSITRPLIYAVSAADRVALGDLSCAIDVGSTDETGRLLSALSRMQTALAHTVGAVRSNAEQVATASAQIAQGNVDLSQRTEEQASSLQQTAASMEMLGTTVGRNAQSAVLANQLAKGASGAAAKGGEVVADVVSTMRGIEASSKRIAEIISVIDGIAFQTNILALNAAVEAARAGEQGRGFAVVASEVRSLAQRSASAAKEIKDLITESVVQVGRGSTLVDHAGSTIQDVVQAIRKVEDVVAEITAASQEQNGSVGEIGQAVAQMDQVTQQNAALVEESAAAADSLSQQARQLLVSVESFRLAA